MIGQQLKRLRLEHGLSQKEMGQKLLLSQTAYFKYENDKTMPTLDLLQRLKETFHISIDNLLQIDSGNNIPEQMANNTDLASIIAAGGG
ncbi:MAG: helix-turn-helix transcriptional regulator [Niabella sp.]